MVHIHNGILLSHKKKNEIMPFPATRFKPEILILGEVSQKIKGKYHILSHIWNLKYSTNEPICKTEIDSESENRLVVAKGKREEGLGWLRSLGSVDVNYSIQKG